MFGTSQEIFVELRALIEQLGDHGGLISPSVYETAQVLRLHPPVEGAIAGLEWLLTQQGADGGWGIPTVPSTRDVPTLAAILALYTYCHEIAAEDAIQAGLAFLKRQAPQWKQMHIDLLPVACELILPYLLEEAEEMGLLIDEAPYARLFELRNIKLKILEGKPLRPNSAPTLSWEALGHPYTPTVLHARTGVGHSPAATAAWLNKAKEAVGSSQLIQQAETYLKNAALTTETGIPGVVPMAYPITGFELCYGLYALHLTGMLNHPKLRDVVAPKIAKLREMVDEEQGLGFGEGFVPDVDDTAVAVAVLLAAHQPTNIEYVRRFWYGDHFYTFAHELNPSVFSNAHALHALVLSGETCKLTEAFLIQQQTESGAWVIDKWHTSWRSSTLEVVAALLPLNYEEQLRKAGLSLITDQNEDGSWGESSGAPILETTYCVIALQLLASIPAMTDMMMPALLRGRKWLEDRLECLHGLEHAWICKEVFSPVRVDGVYKLCALLSPYFEQVSQSVSQPLKTTPMALQLQESR